VRGRKESNTFSSVTHKGTNMNKGDRKKQTALRSTRKKKSGKLQESENISQELINENTQAA
jgi:hypothetical protein